MKKQKTNLDDFVKSKLKNNFESGLVAARNTLSAYVYDEEMTNRTINKIKDNAVGISLLLGVTATAFMAATDTYPKNEALSNINSFFKAFDKATMSSTGVLSGLGVGAFLSAQTNRIVTGKKWHFNKNKPPKEDSKISLKGMIEAIDVYLYKNNPELYEQSEEIVALKKDKILENDALKIKKQQEKQVAREIKKENNRQALKNIFMRRKER